LQCVDGGDTSVAAGLVDQYGVVGNLSHDKVGVVVDVHNFHADVVVGQQLEVREIGIATGQLLGGIDQAVYIGGARHFAHNDLVKLGAVLKPHDYLPSSLTENSHHRIVN
jgi:hypothetical protein